MGLKILISKKQMMMTTQTNEHVKNGVLPAKHIEIRLVKAIETYLLASRGTFKTSRGIALYILEKVAEMPGSTGVGVGLSYEHLSKNTLPPLKLAFIELGWKENEDFVIGKRPPDHFKTPVLGVVNNNYKNTISFKNGSVIQLISLKVMASANGISAQWGFFDEVKFMKQKQLQDEIFPIFRGLEHLYGKCHGYLSKFFATDKLADPAQIKWLLKKRKLNNPLKIKVIITLQQQLDELQARMAAAGINASLKLKKQIEDIDAKLFKLRATMVHVVEISAYDVLPIMGERWFKTLTRNITGHEFKVAVENKDPDKPEVSFYPDFKDTYHVHNRKNDYDTRKPLIIAIDYQHEVTPITIAQIVKLDDVACLNYCDEVYTLATPIDKPHVNGNGSKGELQEALDLFCKRYAHHSKRIIYYVYDATAKGKRVNADRYYDTVKRVLKKGGWSVVPIDTGRQPGHYQKFIDTKDWMQEIDPRQLVIRINKRCEKTIVSINGAGATTVNEETKKDKSAEKVEGIDQSETTHFSDTFDMSNHAVLKLKMIKPRQEKKPLGFGRAAA